MWHGEWVVLAIGFVIVVGNVATVRLIWASAAFATSQKIAQTALVWMLPGSFLFVRYVLREAPGQARRHPTAPAASIGDYWYGTSGHRADDGRGPGGDGGAGSPGGGEGGG